jgi:hypothetical protein
MRLTDLKPHWIGLNQWASESVFIIGLSFLCPHCDPNLPEHGENRRRRLAVNFWPPIDPDKLMGRMFSELPHDGYHRRESGDSFDTLTIEPSIGFDSIGHWHGRITNGEIR